VAELSLSKAVPQDVAFEKVPRPALMTKVVAYVASRYSASDWRACYLTRQHRSAQRNGKRAPV
jgi:hypothetical protein